MRDSTDVPVAVVSSRRELDLAITTWVPGYVARRAPDVDTVIDLTSGGGLVLLDLADEDRTDWLNELHEHGFDGPLVVITPSELRDSGALAGNVLVPAPLQLELLGQAFADALRRHAETGPHRRTSRAGSSPESTKQPDPAAEDPAAAPSTAVGTEPHERSAPRRSERRGRTGRGPFRRRRRSNDLPPGASPPGPTGDQLAEAPGFEATTSPTDDRPSPAVPSDTPPPPAPARPPTAEPAPGTATSPAQPLRPGPPPPPPAVLSRAATGGPPPADPGSDDAAAGEATTSAELPESTPSVGPSPLNPDREDGALVVSDAAACAWLLLADLDDVIRDGGAVVALRGPAGEFATVAGTGIAPLEGAAQVPHDHPVLRDAAKGPAVLHVPRTASSHRPLEGLPLADCPALLLTLIPGRDEPAAMLLIGRGAPFEPREIDGVVKAVSDVPSLLGRVHRSRREADVTLDTDDAAAASTSTFPGLERGSGRVVPAAASAAWRLLHDAFPLLHDAAALVALRGTDGWYAPVAATREDAFEGIRAVPNDHPLLRRVAASDGSSLVVPRTEDREWTAGLPLADHASLMTFAIGPANDPDALLLVGSSRVAGPTQLQPFLRLVSERGQELVRVATAVRGERETDRHGAP